MGNLPLKSSFIGGTLLTTFTNIHLDDILFSVVMAVIGAIVSFFVSLVLMTLFSKTKKNL